MKGVLIMANNNFYYVIVNTENGKNYAHAQKVSGKLNLLSVLQAFKNASVVHQCKTLKSACELAGFWNECYKKNNTYMFDTAPLF